MNISKIIFKQKDQLYEIKKADWLAWLDLPKNAAIKAATFSYEILDE